MSSRRGRNTAGIRGPHSALTDFLAANNISAQEIRDSYRQRLERAAQDAATAAENGDTEAQAAAEEEQAQAESSAMAEARSRKRKRDQEDAIAKIKKGKEAKKAAAKKNKKKKKASSDDDGSDFDIENMYKKAKKLPGQLENCELCDKRFTVTPYSKVGPDGGLICTPCGKDIAKEAKATEKARKPVVRKGRRKAESNRLDGITHRGPKTLQQICVEKLAKHAEDIDELGELPEAIMDQLSAIFSKKRAMNSTTFKLFLQPDMDRVAVHEAAYLETEDFNQIFAVVPNIKQLALRNCCQFKDTNVDYMIEKAKKLTHIQLLGANLVSNDKWCDLFIARGHDLKSFKVEWLDAAFDDQAVEALTTFCPNLERLKLERCKRLGTESIDAIAQLQNLQHLSLRFCNDIPREHLINLVTSAGAHLETLCLENFVGNDPEDVAEDGTDDELLETIHNVCHKLSKLRFTENHESSDQAYVNLFTDWNNPPLRYIDLNSTRDVDNANPEGPEDNPIGLASEGFKALMAHSGSRLEYLDISSCRHISKETLYEIFDGVKQYPNLQEINMSFCPVVDTVVVAGIFRSCPKIQKVVTFGCFAVQDVIVPRGIVLIGAPKAQDAVLEQFGDVVMDFQKDLMKELEKDRAAGRLVAAMA